MPEYKIPVDFTLTASNAELAAVHMDNFLRHVYKEYANLYRITDYELPVGYPIESSSP
jgi:hypothetical protein